MSDKKETPKPNNQVGGTHYSDLAIEPIQFIESNELGYCEGNAVKYISRWRNKNGVEDLKKAVWYIERLIQVEELNIAEERREELREVINSHFGCEAPCEYCEDADEAPSEPTEESVVEYIEDLHFFEFYDMSPESRERVRMEAEANGVDIAEQLRMNVDATEDDMDALKWSEQ